MVLSGPFAFWDHSNKLCPFCLPRASKGRVDVKHQGSCRIPGTAKAAFIPFCSERARPCSGGGQRAVGTQRCLPRSAPRVPLWSLPPPCVLACFYNKDNSAASCHFSSLSLAGGTNESPLWLYTACPLDNKQVQRPLGCTSCCKYLAKMLDPRRKSMVWGFVRRDQGSGSL